MHLEDELAIRRLKHEYCQTVDAGDYETWVELFTPDGLFAQAGEEPVSGRAELCSMIRDEFDDAFAETAHVTTNPVIEIDGDVASGRWYITFVYETTDGRVGWNQGVYDDTYRRVDGEWRIAESTVDFHISKRS